MWFGMPVAAAGAVWLGSEVARRDIYHRPGIVEGLKRRPRHVLLPRLLGEVVAASEMALKPRPGADLGAISTV